MKQHPTTAARAAAAAAAVLALALGAVGCNGDGTDPAAGTAPAQATAAGTAGTAPESPAGSVQATAKAATTGGTGTGPAPAAATTRCHTADLKADVQVQEGGGRALVMLTNTSGRTCTVKGYLGYGGLAADNSRVDVATSRVAKPGPPVTVTLKSGTTAFSGLSWSTCDKADPTCAVLAGVVVTPPDETTQLTAVLLGTDGKPAIQLPVSAAGFVVGTLQPSNQGVLLG
ncbi:DUF4232 domain-containing protein [Kitasatospora sp. NBC_01539]|uniref:DUF4232 domain-containing protein n=1 Tax=Kitasatospora sp. NBC_01539 TaxID=2903577 RepID=UPI00386009A7